MTAKQTKPEKKMDAQTICMSAKYAPYIDILQANLDEGTLYSESDVDELIKKACSHIVTKDINK